MCRRYDVLKLFETNKILNNIIRLIKLPLKIGRVRYNIVFWCPNADDTKSIPFRSLNNNLVQALLSYIYLQTTFNITFNYIIHRPINNQTEIQKT